MKKMLITEYIRTKIGNMNINHFRSLGYECNLKDFILVKVDDLNKHNKTSVIVKCDYCGEIKDMLYETYLLNLNSTEIHRYSCIHCKDIKKKELARRRQELGKLTRNDSYYWTYKENVLKELQKYIDEYGFVNEINLNNHQLYSAIIKHKYILEDLIEELGYNINDVYNNKPYGYYDDKDNLVSTVQLFVDKYGKFPSLNELSSQMEMASAHVYKHFNSLSELKIHMGYDDENDLIDRRGDSNRSLYELYLGNYLVSQGLGNNYKREQHPFKKFDKKIKYRSDFTLYPKDDKIIHVEVWGDKSGGGVGQLFGSYCETRRLKEIQYAKYSDEFTLVGINPEVFLGTYEQMENKLYLIFKDILPLNFKKVDVDLLLPFHKLNEQELFKELMSYSDNEKYLPKGVDLKLTDGGRRILNYITTKYGGLNYFADKFNIKMKDNKINYWDDIKIFEGFDYLIETYGRIVTYNQSKQLKDDNISGLFRQIQKNGGHVLYKLKYINYCIDNSTIISDTLMKYLYDASINKLNGVKTVDPQHQLLAKQILEKYNKQQPA